MNNKIKTLVTILMLASGLFTYAHDGFRPWYYHHVNGVNRLPARATSYSYESEQDALVKDRRTSRMMLPNGMWKFHFAAGRCRVTDILSIPTSHIRSRLILHSLTGTIL